MKRVLLVLCCIASSPAMAYDDNAARMEGVYRAVVRHCAGDARADEYNAYSKELLRQMFDAATAEKYEKDIVAAPHVSPEDVKMVQKDDCKAVLVEIDDLRAFMAKRPDKVSASKRLQETSLRVMRVFPDR